MSLFMPALEPEERVLWRAWKSPYRCALGLFLAAVAWQVFGAVGVALSAATALPLVYWFCIRNGVRFALTDRRVLRLDALGRTRAMPLADVRDFRRFELVATRTRGPRRGERETSYFNELYFFDGEGVRMVFGYPADSDALEQLMQGHLGRYLRLDELPAVDVRRGDAYQRADVFLARRCFIEGMEYGPLFVGPGLIARYRSAMARAHLAQLERLVASHLVGDALEAALRGLLREECPMLAWTWRDPEVRVTERGLALPIDGALCEVTLSPDDLARFLRSPFARGARGAHR